MTPLETAIKNVERLEIDEEIMVKHRKIELANIQSLLVLLRKGSLAL